MRLRKAAAVGAALIIAGTGVGMGAATAQAAPLTATTAHTRSVQLVAPLPCAYQSEHWRISRMSLTYGGVTNATGDPVCGPLRMPKLFGARFDNGSGQGHGGS